jgi:hypothetical protein
MRRAIQWSALLLLINLCSLPNLVAQEEAEDDGVIRLDVIVAAMQQNHAAADERFVGKQLQVQGRALRVVRYRLNKDEPTQYILTLGASMANVNGPGPIPDISFIFPNKERPGLADITPGALVVVRGTCRDNESSANGLQLRFDDCRLIRILKAPEGSDVTDPSAPDRPGSHPTVPRPTRPVRGGFPALPPMGAPAPMP